MRVSREALEEVRPRRVPAALRQHRQFFKEQVLIAPVPVHAERPVPCASSRQIAGPHPGLRQPLPSTCRRCSRHWTSRVPTGEGPLERAFPR